MQCTGVDNKWNKAAASSTVSTYVSTCKFKAFSHWILFECELNSHSPDVHRMRIEFTLIMFTLPKFITKLCYWHATPTAAQVTVSTLDLPSQHSRCIETHTKVRPIICLTLLLHGGW